MVDLSKYFYLFYQFIATYQKVYDEHTFNTRLAIFVQNYEFIQQMNSQDNTFTLGINKFSDMTLEEFQKTYTGALTNGTTGCSTWTPPGDGPTPPPTLDWREKHIITPVKDQGQCGSCWAFAAAEVLESAYALKTGVLNILSPQELVDCESTSFGCSGGYPDHALEYASEHGLELEQEYPYTASDGKCTAKDTSYKVSPCTLVPTHDEKVLQQAVTIAPVVVLIEADQRVFQFYQSGIIPQKSCGASIDHAVQLVGYGDENGKQYWLVRNSWGASWGEDGYVKLERGVGGSGTCGILTGPSGYLG